VLGRKYIRRSPVYERGNVWILIAETLMYPGGWLFGRRRVLGLENLVRPGPVLLVGNHISELDPLYHATVIRLSGRLPHIMAKASLWKVPFLGRGLVGTGQIPVDRGNGRGQVGLDAAIAELRSGKMVFIYPDGTVTRDPDHWPMRPRPGVASLALSVPEAAVVPLVIWGTQDVVPYGAKKKRFRPLPRKDITLKAGPPIDLSEFRGVEVDTRVLREVSIRIMTAVRDTLGEVRGEQPPTAFYDPKKAERAARAASGAEEPPPAGR
jgi:1-acyl-sn-glycerol-3-phosphate acyltransferase